MRKYSKKIIWFYIVFAFLFLVEISSAVPDEQWNKTFGGSNFDWANSVQQTSDGDYIIAGGTYSFGAGNYDAWLIKTDSSGNEQWNKTFGGEMSDRANSVQQTSDGGYILAGYADSGNAWLIKTDAYGNENWDKKFILNGGADEAYSAMQTSDGGYILAGEVYTSSEGFQAWLIKTDSNGNEQWNKTFGGNNIDWAKSVQQTSDGGYILAGMTQSYGSSGGCAWLIKTDLNGNEQWNKTLSGGLVDKANFVKQTLDEGYILAGGVGYDAWLSKTDSNGNEQWNKTFIFELMEEAYSVQQTSDNGYILTGLTSTGTNYYSWLIKTNTNGNQEWNKTFGFTGSDKLYSVQQTIDDGYIITGETNGDVWLIKLGEDISNSIGYSATVATGQNTFMQSSNGNFGLLLKGQTKTLNNSVILNNTGDISARVEARFNDSISGVFGLISGANLLNATNFALGQSGSLVSLDSNGADVQIATVSQGVTALDARLGVPSEQMAGDYSGTVVLTFSNGMG